jgi:vitamin B12/bleomycin/antimicrobial peptide transport system ATP-binding/permease protein
MRGLGRLLKNVWFLSAPYLRSEEKWSAWGLLLFVLAADFALVRVSVLVNLNGGAWVNALQNYDAKSFFNLLLLWEPSPDGPFGIIPGFVPLVVVAIVILVNGRYMRQWLQIRWRRWLTARYQADWLAKQAYYRLQLQPETLGNDNPDQRISDDIRDFIESGLVLGFGFITSIVSLFSFLAVLWQLSFPITVLGVTIPAYLVWVALLYSVFGTILAQVVGRPLLSLNFIRQRLEADFRFALVRLRENAEGVALYKGERDEAALLNTRFGAIVANFRRLMSRNRALNAMVYGYGELAGVFPWFAATPLYFAKKISFGNLSRVAGAFGEVQGAASWVVDNYAALADWAATVERLATFSRALEAVHMSEGTGIAAISGAGPDLSVRDLRLVLPDGTVLLNEAALRFHPGISTVITGKTGSGKSTLFRALAGIWPYGSGTIERPVGTALFLPQKPYIPLGTLRRALGYPAAVDGYSDEAAQAALTDAGLARLAPDLDVDAAWSQRLSGGEQQRLALARVLLTRPDWLFLDEATANLDPEGQADLYRILRERLPGTSVVSISHAPEVARLHDRQLVLQRREDGGMLVPGD